MKSRCLKKCNVWGWPNWKTLSFIVQKAKNISQAMLCHMAKRSHFIWEVNLNYLTDKAPNGQQSRKCQMFDKNTVWPYQLSLNKKRVWPFSFHRNTSIHIFFPRHSLKGLPKNGFTSLFHFISHVSSQKKYFCGTQAVGKATSIKIRPTNEFKTSLDTIIMSPGTLKKLSVLKILRNLLYFASFLVSYRIYYFKSFGLGLCLFCRSWNWAETSSNNSYGAWSLCYLLKSKICWVWRCNRQRTHCIESIWRGHWNQTSI